MYDERYHFDTVLQIFCEAGLLKARGKQRTDSTHVLAAIRELHRLENVGETMRHALDRLALVGPTWLREHADPAARGMPRPTAPTSVRVEPAVELLRKVWIQARPEPL